MSHNLGPGVIVGEELLPSNDAVIERNLIEGAGGGGISVIESSDVRSWRTSSAIRAVPA